MTYLGQDLVLFRGEDGIARVFDAYCPHLGAHLGIGGRVCGDGLACPFHGWRFDGEGHLAEVPGLDRKPRASAGHGQCVSVMAVSLSGTIPTASLQLRSIGYRPNIQLDALEINSSGYACTCRTNREHHTVPLLGGP